MYTSLKSNKYLNQIKQSPAFKAIDKELKQIVLKARGQELKQYYDIFVDANDLLQKAFEDFSAKNLKIINEMKNEMKNVERNKLDIDEKNSDRQDTESAEGLLSKLNQIN